MRLLDLLLLTLVTLGPGLGLLDLDLLLWLLLDRLLRDVDLVLLLLDLLLLLGDTGLPEIPLFVAVFLEKKSFIVFITPAGPAAASGLFHNAWDLQVGRLFSLYLFWKMKAV